MTNETETAPGRRPGRPRLGEAPVFDENDLERLLVHGEFETPTDDSPATHRYPSFRELAARFGISKTAVERFASRHNCLERRAHPGSPVATPRMSVGEQATAERKAKSTPQLVREIFRKWVEDVHAGEIRIATTGEIERMFRLSADYEAEAQLRAMLPAGVLSLEEMQDLYERRTREYEQALPGERGLVPIGIDDPSEPQPDVIDAHASSTEDDPDA